jgi:hypothetical protein
VFTSPGNHTVATFKTLFRQHLTTLASQSQPTPFVLSSQEKTSSTF